MTAPRTGERPALEIEMDFKRAFAALGLAARKRVIFAHERRMDQLVTPPFRLPHQ